MAYTTKTGGAFRPGGFSLHNTMLPQGPDMQAFEAASHADLRPYKLEGTLAFMFETWFPQRVTGMPPRQPSGSRVTAITGTSQSGTSIPPGHEVLTPPPPWGG